MSSPETVVRQWLATIVVGLNLCPFAARPLREGQLRIFVSAAQDELELLTDLQLELQQLDTLPASVLETTVIVIPTLLADFAGYNDFLDNVDELLERQQWSGHYQVASFHPQYQFAGTRPQDAENLSNRAPYPLLHLLREDSVEAALASHPDPAQIPKDNIRRLRQLDRAERRRLFAYLPGESQA